MVKRALLFVTFIFALIIMTVTVTAAPCNTYASENDCNTNSCYWHPDDGHGAYCTRPGCFTADQTNQSYCETINVTFSLTESCVWNQSGNEECDPIGGDFFGNSCDDFNNDSTGCFSTYFCLWNATSEICSEPAGFDHESAGAQNPSCSIIGDNETCLSIAGCSWNAGTSTCSGNDNGITCSQLNKTIGPDGNDLCASATFLSSCCAWNGTGCGASFVQECYNNVPSLPIGAAFCEDFNSFENETLCNQLAGSPWFMPCKFNQSGKEQCKFNADAFGGGDFASFDEIGSEAACEAQGGKWQEEQWQDASGALNTDSWCEFNFGGAGNCDSSCWACETASAVTSLATAQTTCENSALGYCEFRTDSFAPNTYGWCNPKQDFLDAGGKSCDDECSACDFLLKPEEQCVGSFQGCIWVNDSNADNGVGNCYGQSEKYCGNDCFSCYTENDCATGNGGSGACSWDNTTKFCKTTGFTGEVCFDGTDNDNDGQVDCADAECASDKFCGGDALTDQFGDCLAYFGPNANESCINAGCVWVIDDFDQQFGGEGAGHCDFPGAQCWILDDDSSTCDATEGCTYFNDGSGFCGENFTLFDSCFQAENATACAAAGQITGSCGWVADAGHPQGGRCELIQFAQCFNNETRWLNQSNCESNVTVAGLSTQPCSWSEDPFAPNGGRCDAVCFGLQDGSCTDNIHHGLCDLKAGFCEPDSFGGKCISSDGNQSMCEGALNSTCIWTNDPAAMNNQSGDGNAGWCDPIAGHGFAQGFIGDIEPVVIGEDVDEAGIGNEIDIAGIGIRDDFDRFGFGTKLYDNFQNSSTCFNVPVYDESGLGLRRVNTTFFWYLDTNGNTADGCAARDNSSLGGFEFSFKYQGIHDGTTLTETKVSYRCVDSVWGPTPIPLVSDQAKACNVVGGALAGITKTEMFKFKQLFNKSADMRLYATVSNVTTNDSVAIDVTGPHYYSQGSVDFKFEDCSNPGGDVDEDGLTASNDPDCFNFLKFGFNPNEAGFACADNEDNDADGFTDCADPGCSYTVECGGTGQVQPNANDVTAPTVIWQSVDTFPDAAFVMFDTDEPANGSLAFYNQDASCRTLNATVRDAGVYDSFLPEFKMWHDAPLDNNSWNPEALATQLPNGTAFYYKTTVCDINNNCAVSACLNFTTKANLASCSSCTSTFNFPFDAPAGSNPTDPLGALNFQVELPDGSASNLTGNAQAGSQFSYNQMKNFNLEISNPNSTTSWHFKMINASVNGKISSGIQNFSSGDKDINFNSTSTGDFFGMGQDKCQELINTFRPKKLEIGVPGNNTELWQCDDGLDNCTLKSVGTNATNLGYDVARNVTIWEVPAEWGC